MGILGTLFPVSLGTFLSLLFCFKPETCVLGTAGSTGLRGQKADVFLLTLADPKDFRELIQIIVSLKLNPELDFQTGASFAGLLALWVF